MWKDYKPKKIKPGQSNPRLRLFATLIFLFLIALICRLYYLQIVQGDWYKARALRQHNVSSLLNPARGKIMLHEKLNGEDHLFPLATNKDFAFLYAIPKDIENPRAVADILFAVFDEETIREEIKEQVKKEKELTLLTQLAEVDKSEISAEEKIIKKNSLESLAKLKADSAEWKEIEASTIDRLIEKRKEEVLINYLKRVDKPGDPYEPLKYKLTDEKLLEVYAKLISDENRSLRADDLERKLEKIYLKGTDEEINFKGIAFSLESYRYYPENELTGNIVGFVSNSDAVMSGHYGLEEFFNSELTGSTGYLKGERGAGNTVIVNDREYVKAESGSDIVLTMDRGVQFHVCAALEGAMNKYQAEGGSVIAVNAKTGAILAMCSLPSFNPNNYNEVTDISLFNNPAILYQYEPGSVFKVITMAAAIDGSELSPATTFKDEGQIMIKGWPKAISNSDFSTKGGHGLVDMNYVLENSLNTGAIFAMTKIGPNIFAEYVKKFGFGEKTGIELGAESPGDISNLLRNRVREIDAATASFGQGVAVTSLQMLMSIQAIANQGNLMKPYIVQEIRHHNGQIELMKPQTVNQAVTSQTANTVLAMMVNVVERGHAKGAQIPGYYIGGKTGTAQVAIAGGYSADKYIHTFVGVAPAYDPQIVMLTRLDAPKGVRFAEGSVVPLWHDIAEFMLKYYQIPKTR
ncbi:MAG: penicillin-binding protein 2 [Clostridia bacterium]|nr:penicillin-binding protein 2 [Clostridia bacterium]